MPLTPAPTAADADTAHARLVEISNPSIEQALLMADDLTYRGEHGAWRDGLPAWCREWADLLHTTPAMIDAQAWQAIARTLIAERRATH